MQTKETITLSGVPETMLQTVYARAKESSGRGAIRDRKAEETIGGLQYDFSLADRDKAMHSGVIARTIVLDRLTGAWLQEHPGGTVVNVACGLDTRCYRMEGRGFCRKMVRSRRSPCPPWTTGAGASLSRIPRHWSSSRA